MDHFRRRAPALVALLDEGAVTCHPFVIGELALGSLRQRTLCGEPAFFSRLQAWRAMLHCSPRIAGDRMRIAVQFTSARDGYLLWAGTFDRLMDDVFAIQADTAHRVAEAVEFQLRGGGGG